MQNYSKLSVLPTIATIENVQLSPALDGSNGINRSIGNRPQITANTDIDAIRVWLARYSDTKTTFDSYRKEAERLLLWSVAELGKPLSSLTHEDFLVYQRFLVDPQPAERWIMTQRKVSRDNPIWRPFAGPLFPTSQRQAIVILNGMFSWLVNAGYLAGNPLSLSRNRQRKAKPRITRFLDEDLWNEVKLTIESMPRETNREREHYYRIRWLFSLLYISGIRASEVTQNTMGGFFCRKDKSSESRWWLEITGKGDKTRIIPATNELMLELGRYRREMGLSLTPIEGEPTPLLLPIGGKLRGMTRSAIHLILKQVFKNTAKRLIDRGDESTAQVARLEAASAHWMRHTAGSNMTSSNMDIRHVRDNLGHESLTTTNNYLHSEDDKRHQDTEENHRLKW
ncbi:MAG: tyrosine-type recombinase/integrase [Methylotenera sp.]|uniref:tyrosine-type recombinase/integrase n=1 Tax=Methylotenera sp. TaxID=2051956 RepID=UPI002489B84E|nr:tyrosine-type recombinase/integrase [Methylotenera sp.]MDI1309267.1 tyrosine-type recombinase/integrase [Methylotenera sp.]